MLRKRELGPREKCDVCRSDPSRERLEFCVQKRCSPEEAVDKTPVIDDRSGTRLGSSLRVDGKALKAERRD